MEEFVTKGQEGILPGNEKKGTRVPGTEMCKGRAGQAQRGRRTSRGKACNPSTAPAGGLLRRHKVRNKVAARPAWKYCERRQDYKGELQ